MKVTVIKASSRVSTKIGDTFYTVEYGEERSVEGAKNLKAEREKLWNTCNTEVDRQIEEILKINQM